MELGPRAKSIYSSTQWGDYKERLKKELWQKGLSAVQIVNNSDYKTYVGNYVEENVVNAKGKNALLGITHKLANIELTKGAAASVYPVINEYKGHDLVKIYYFSTTDDGGITHVVFPVKQEKPIILLP